MHDAWTPGASGLKRIGTACLAPNMNRITSPNFGALATSTMTSPGTEVSNLASSFGSFHLSALLADSQLRVEIVKAREIELEASPGGHVALPDLAYAARALYIKAKTIASALRRPGVPLKQDVELAFDRVAIPQARPGRN